MNEVQQQTPQGGLPCSALFMELAHRSQQQQYQQFGAARRASRRWKLFAPNVIATAAMLARSGTSIEDHEIFPVHESCKDSKE